MSDPMGENPEADNTEVSLVSFNDKKEFSLNPLSGTYRSGRAVTDNTSLNANRMKRNS